MLKTEVIRSSLVQASSKAFPKACVIRINEKERGENRGADKEHNGLFRSIFPVKKPEKKRKPKTDYISAEDVHGPMYPEIKP